MPQPAVFRFIHTSNFILHISTHIFMSPKNLSLPDLGIDDQPIFLSVWLAKRGAEVKEGEPLVEVLCGGVTVDLPSPTDGILAEKLVAEDEILSVGQQLAVIEEAV
jgi:pyruvate/2-oxoglutarate dehydrogenase complex dihydrolipoamide acyltransferase (E2) component